MISEDMFEKLEASHRIRFPSADDESVIRTAAEEGCSATELSDGSVLVENIFTY